MVILPEVCCRKWSKSSVQYKKGRSTDEFAIDNLYFCAGCLNMVCTILHMNSPQMLVIGRKIWYPLYVHSNRRKGPEMRKDQTDMIWNMTVLLLGALVLLAGGRLLFFAFGFQSDRPWQFVLFLLIFLVLEELFSLFKSRLFPLLLRLFRPCLLYTSPSPRD